MAALEKSIEAVYTIAPAAAIEFACAHRGHGVLIENRRWATAARALQEHQAEGRTYPLLLADASCIVGVEWVAEVTAIALDPAGGTRIEFSKLRPLPRVIRRSALYKLSDGQHLSEDYIRPYLPCTVRGTAARMVVEALAHEATSVGWQEAAVRQELSEDAQYRAAHATTQEALVAARLGQGAYRARMLALWGGRCAVTGCQLSQVLVASHAKPWHLSSNAERLDEYNGLLLAAHVDKLFDAGLIGFDEKGKLLRKPQVDDKVLASLGLSPAACLTALSRRHQPYLAAHRERFGLLPVGTDR